MLVLPDAYVEAFNRLREAFHKTNTLVHVLVAPGCDGLAAWAILKSLFRSEAILFSEHAVAGYLDVGRFKEEILLPKAEEGELHSVVCINCGAKEDMLSFFFGDEDIPDIVTIYIFDNHRPYDLYNVHNQQILLFDKEGARPQEDYPFPVQEEEEEEAEREDDLDFGADLDGFDGPMDKENVDSNMDFDEPSDGSRKRKRLRQNDANDERARKRRKKLKTQEQYYSVSTYGPSSASMMFGVAEKIAKADNDMIWCAILGVTDMYIQDHMARDKYGKSIEKLSTVVAQRNVSYKSADGDFHLIAEIAQQNDADARDEDSRMVKRRPNGHIQKGYEFQFFLMRHWCLYQSMYHSRYVSTQLGVWKESGKELLDEMLAKMGLALKETECPFPNMGASKRQVLSSNMKEYMEPGSTSMFEAFHMGKDLAYPSFTRQHGANFMSAADMVHVVTALLEDDAYRHVDDLDEADAAERPGRLDCFNNALDCLDWKKPELFKRGVEAAIRRQKDVVATGTSIIDKELVNVYPCLRCATVEHKSNFTTPISLVRLALFVCDAYARFNHQGQARAKYIPKPFVLATKDEERDLYMVAGVPSRGAAEKKSENSFFRAFRKSAQEVDARFQHDGFEGSVIEVQCEDYKRFYDHLLTSVIDYM